MLIFLSFYSNCFIECKYNNDESNEWMLVYAWVDACLCMNECLFMHEWMLVYAWVDACLCMSGCLFMHEWMLVYAWVDAIICRIIYKDSVAVFMFVMLFRIQMSFYVFNVVQNTDVGRIKQ